MTRGRDALTWLAPVRGRDTELFDSIDRFHIGEVEFHCSCDERASVRSVPGRFFIRKDRLLVEEYLDVLDGFPNGNIVELGIAGGAAPRSPRSWRPPGSWSASSSTRGGSTHSTT